MKPCTLTGSNPAVTKGSVGINMMFTFNDNYVLRSTVFIWNSLDVLSDVCFCMNVSV